MGSARPWRLLFAATLGVMAACTDRDSEGAPTPETAVNDTVREPAPSETPAKAEEIAVTSLASAPWKTSPHKRKAPAPSPPTNTGGTPPGPAFLMRLSDGFDDATQYRSAYTMEEPWNGSGFSPDNIHYGPNGATLVIQKRRMLGLAYAGAELQRKGFYGYGRYEVVMKPALGSGLVSSFFVHTNRQFGDPHDEIDIEFLGRDPYVVHLNYFRNGVAAGSFYAPTGFDASLDFHLYAFEWAPDSIRWYIDGQLVHAVKGASARTPRASGRVMMSLWSAGPTAVEWLGAPHFKNNASATYRCVSHVPLGQKGAQCSDNYQPPEGRADR